MNKKFVIATNNPHKVEEFKKILSPMGIDCYSLKELGIVCDAEETGTTFAENAYIKAKAVYDLCKLFLGEFLCFTGKLYPTPNRF